MNPKGLLATSALLWCASAMPAVAQQAQVTSPHGKLEPGLACTDCHTTAGWRPVRAELHFDHSKTGFRLTGRHAEVPCAGCHLDLRFDAPRLAPGDCGSCHVDVHQARMPGTCSECHDTRAFQDAAHMDVHARTSFPLTGVHSRLACDACHRNDNGGAFTSLPMDCYSCHASAYRNARAVDHVAAHFPTDCRQCHGTASWVGAAFDHAAVSGGFALTGRHAQLACTACHLPPDNHLIATPSSPDDCVACHQADYNSAHSGSGFPTTCTTCHTTNGWSAANLDHDQRFFPIYSGSHAGRWSSCTDCHTDPSNFQVFTCLTCHLKTQTDQQHGDVRGYVYDSAHCLSCHPTGRGGG